MTQLPPLTIDGQSLTLEDIVAVAREGRPAALAASAREGIAASRAYVESLLQPGAPPVYGINTGFGIFADRPVSPGDSARLSRNLILSHAVGVGPAFPEDVVRAVMLIRANTLALGHSGVRPEVVETLLAMLNAGVHPVIPEQGSLGSSGDLAPLAHLALIFTTGPDDQAGNGGQADFKGKRMSGPDAMQAAGIPRLALTAKEGLALTNGATFSAALAALAVHDADNLIRHAEVATAMALEALLGVPDAFEAALHAARRHTGQQAVAAHLRALTAGSTYVGASGRVQDPYSLRCAPQILGPARDTLEFVRGWVLAEINAATDNPLIFPQIEGALRALSGGNFHGEVMGLAADFLAIAMAEVGALLERQINRMVSDKHSYGLPPMLVDSAEAAGLNSGLMMPHYTAVAMVLENQTLAHPDSVHSLPTSAGQEDHNANALTAARHARQVLMNVTTILAVAFLAGAQAMELRRRLVGPEGRWAPATAAALARIRQEVSFVGRDRLMQPDLDRLSGLVRQGGIVRAVVEATGLEF